MKEIDWLKKQRDMIHDETCKALEANTDNGRQSIIIYHMWQTQIEKRLREIK